MGLLGRGNSRNTRGLYAGYLAHSRCGKSGCCCCNDIWNAPKSEEEDVFAKPQCPGGGVHCRFPTWSGSSGLELQSIGARRELGDSMHYILPPILKLRKLKPERVTFPLVPTPCVTCVRVVVVGGCRSSPSRSWGPSQGSVRQTHHHPRALCGEHQGAPDLGGDLGGTPAESNPQPHTSQKQLGSRQGERQLSCSLCPFVSVSAEALSAPPAGLFVADHWRLHYLPSTISSSPLLNAAPKEGVHHRLPWNRAGLGMGRGQCRDEDRGWHGQRVGGIRI